jgi:hypothetical protein
VPGIAPEETQAKMIEAYLAGATMAEAAAMFGYTAQACRRALKRRGVLSRGRKYISQEDRAKLVELYLAGHSQEQAGALLGHCRDACRAALIEAGVRPRPALHRTYQLNESYFDSVTRPEQAYLLGFLATDGNIARNLDCVSISLAREDRAQLFKVREALGSNSPVRDGTHYTYGVLCEHSTIQFHSVRLARAVNALGIGPAKTFRVRPWRGPDPLMAAYWLGAFDGDGGFYLRENRRKYWALHFCGNRHMVRGFARFVAARTGVAKCIRQHGSIFEVRYTRLSSIQAIIRALWGSSPIYLDRKERLARLLMGFTKQARDWGWLTREYLLKLYSELETWSAVAGHLGVNVSQFTTMRKRFGLNPWFIPSPTGLCER